MDGGKARGRLQLYLRTVQCRICALKSLAVRELCGRRFVWVGGGGGRLYEFLPPSCFSLFFPLLVYAGGGIMGRGGDGVLGSMNGMGGGGIEAD